MTTYKIGETITMRLPPLPVRFLPLSAPKVGEIITIGPEHLRFRVLAVEAHGTTFAMQIEKA